MWVGFSVVFFFVGVNSTGVVFSVVCFFFFFFSLPPTLSLFLVAPFFSFPVLFFFFCFFLRRSERPLACHSGAVCFCFGPQRWLSSAP